MIGCGRIGERHAKHIENIGTLAAVCDSKFARAKTLAGAHGAEAYSSVDELLAKETELDLVAVCSPNGLHAEHTIKALKAGNHVLVEKPMAISVWECGEMIKAAEKANRRLFAIKQNRFNPPVVALKKAIDDDRLGEIFSVHLNCFWNRNADYYADSDWKGRQAMDGGTLFTQFSHFIDLLYWMVGDVKSAKSFFGNFAHKESIEFEDTGVVALEFYSGALGSIHYTVNAYEKNMEGSFTLFAKNGTVKIGGQYLNELEYHSIEGFEFQDLPSGNRPNEYGTYVGSMSNHGEVYQNVVDVLENGAAISTSCFEGLKTVEIIDKIYASAERPLKRL